MLLFQAGQILLARFIVTKNQDGRCGKGPREIGVPDLLAGRPVTFARRFLGTRDQAAIRHNILDAGEALDLVDCIEPNAGQDCAHSWDGAPTGEGGGVMVLGCTPDRQGQVC